MDIHKISKYERVTEQKIIKLSKKMYEMNAKNKNVDVDHLNVIKNLRFGKIRR
jgi:hypothetical protein